MLFVEKNLHDQTSYHVRYSRGTAWSSLLAAPVKYTVGPVVTVFELVSRMADTNCAVVAIGSITIVDVRDRTAELNGSSGSSALASLMVGEGVAVGSI